jgi:hypothetical protein
MSLTPLADLLEHAARARRLAIAIRHDPAASRLVDLAEETVAGVFSPALSGHPTLFLGRSIMRA